MAVPVLLVAARPAHATLGGDRASIEADRLALKATRVSPGEKTPAGAEELKLPSGVVVDEFVGSDGRVYAVTWRGRRMPDLRTLLGRRFERYAHPRTRLRGSLHRREYTSPGLVVESMGHQRHYWGRAWVPSLVPAGFASRAAGK